jgi:putative membrane protein
MRNQCRPHCRRCLWGVWLRDSCRPPLDPGSHRLLRLLLAATHLLALGIGLGAVWARGRSLRGVVDGAALRRAFAADAWWGVAAVLWLSTGLARLLAGTEKSTAYYLQNPLFHVKMGLFVLVLALEVWPMITLIRWRRAVGRNQTAAVGSARKIARISTIEAFLVVIIVFVAVALARGYTLGSP